MKWPTFESDSRSVIFQTSDTKDSNSYSGYYEEYGSMAPTNKGTVPGKLWSIDSGAASPSAVPLTRLNNGERIEDANKSYQATMLPKAIGGYRWVVFTSTRPYGNTLNTPEGGNQRDYTNTNAYSPVPTAALQSQLWVAAINDTVSAAADRSNPGFWLPNQNAAINERGFWVLDPCVPVGTADANLCSTTEQCCGYDQGTSVCRLDLPVNPGSPTRHCTTVSNAGTCGPLGSACALDADCCQGLLCSPSSGKCEAPPPITLYTASNYTRAPDFEGVCPDGTHVVWRLVQWKSTTPLDSYIDFIAQSADDPATFSAVALAPGATPSPLINVGLASGADAVSWTSSADGLTVDDKLKAIGLYSKRYLRLTARLVPSKNLVAAPGLTDWQATYSCVPSE